MYPANEIEDALHGKEGDEIDAFSRWLESQEEGDYESVEHAYEQFRQERQDAAEREAMIP